MDLINSLIDSYNIPLLTAFLVGILTSISPCPLATNITAVAYISKELKSTKKTILNGLFYTLGRALTYTLLSLLISVGISSFQIANIFQSWGDKVLGPILIVLGLIMLDVIKLKLKGNNEKVERLKETLSKKGYLGSTLLGAMFALAFCPYSGVLFFGVLIPLILKSSFSVLLAPVFGLGTGLPVIIFSVLIAVSMKKFAQVFNLTQKIEIYLRKAVALIFILSGLYYLQYLLKFILSL
jgi:cytochrome c-type biogenesis protein